MPACLIRLADVWRWRISQRVGDTNVTDVRKCGATVGDVSTLAGQESGLLDDNDDGGGREVV
ncbi:hypothetical protein ColKHC_06144 [Colletotrichum higginsianum]|nr:hypothetical protein ColKHC_06144 [Colletotrichum higginsianum]